MSRFIAHIYVCMSVSSVHDVKAIIIGADRGRFKAEINFDAAVLASRCVYIYISLYIYIYIDMYYLI